MLGNARVIPIEAVPVEPQKTSNQSLYPYPYRSGAGPELILNSFFKLFYPRIYIYGYTVIRMLGNMGNTKKPERKHSKPERKHSKPERKHSRKKNEPYSDKEFQRRFFLILLILLKERAFWLTPKPPLIQYKHPGGGFFTGRRNQKWILNRCKKNFSKC